MILSGIANLLAYYWATDLGSFDQIWKWHQAGVFFSGVYSERYFEAQRALWFPSVVVVAQACWMLLWRVYLIVSVFAIIVATCVNHYAWIRNRLPIWTRTWFADLLLPRVAYWHILLSRILLSNDQHLDLDILTKMDFLYQGRLNDKMLGPDGSLINVSLASPRRFDRIKYLADKASKPDVLKANYWIPIPTELFVILASEIHTINLRYSAVLKERPASPDGRAGTSKALNRALEQLVQAALQAGFKESPSARSVPKQKASSLKKKIVRE